jgi:hypothetical protein
MTMPWDFLGVGAATTGAMTHQEKEKVYVVFSLYMLSVLLYQYFQ